MVLIRFSGAFVKWRDRYSYMSPFDIRFELWSKQPMVRTTGVTSRCLDHNHALFFDYDHKLRSFVFEDLGLLANGINYPPGYHVGALVFGRIYVFQTDRTNFMAMCPDRFSLSTAHVIIRQSGCDYAFKSAARHISETATWVLRTAPKGERKPPKYIGYIDNRFTKGHRFHSYGRVKSLFHMLFMVQRMGVPFKDIIWYPNDGLTSGTIVSYKTATRVSLTDARIEAEKKEGLVQESEQAW